MIQHRIFLFVFEGSICAFLHGFGMNFILKLNTYFSFELYVFSHKCFIFHETR